MSDMLENWRAERETAACDLELAARRVQMWTDVSTSLGQERLQAACADSERADGVECHAASQMDAILGDNEGDASVNDDCAPLSAELMQWYSQLESAERDFVLARHRIWMWEDVETDLGTQRLQAAYDSMHDAEWLDRHASAQIDGILEDYHAAEEDEPIILVWPDLLPPATSDWEDQLDYC